MNNIRKNICLNGLWDFAPGDDRIWDDTKICVPSPWNVNSFASSETQNFKGVPLYQQGGAYDLYPSYPKSWESAQSGCYRTFFTVPGKYKDFSIKLNFNAVHFYSEYYINGVFIASDCDGFLPFSFEINKFIEFDCENELIVYVKKIDLFMVNGGTEKEPQMMYEHPTGSFWTGHIGGIWQDVFLEITPKHHICDLTIIAEISSNQLILSADVKSNDNSVINFILQDSDKRDLLSLGTAVVENNKAQFIFDYSAHINLISLWSPDNPKLYYIKAVLQENFADVDVYHERFGFRSFEIVNNRFMLNAVPINLRNDSWHYMGFAYQTPEYARLWYKMAKDANVNCIRLHAQVYPEFFLDIADEMGILLIDESSLWASHCKMFYSPQMFENTKKHMKRLVKRDKNHPSVIIWSIENECVPAYRVTGGHGINNEEELNVLIYDLGKYTQSLDTTRPVSADGSGDLNGRLPIYSLHYPPKYKPIETNKPITIGEMGSMYYSTPDCICDIQGFNTYLSFNDRLEALGKECFNMLKQHRKWAAQVCVFNLVWYGLEPLPYKERFIKYDNLNTFGIKPEKIGACISTLNAGYDPDLPEYNPNPVFNWVKSAYISERTFFENDKNDYFCTDVFSDRISVFNDSFQEKTYDLQITLNNNCLFVSEMKTITLKPAEYMEINVDFHLNEQFIGICDFTVEMNCNSQIIFTDSKKIIVKSPADILKKLNTEKQLVLVGENDTIKSLFDNWKIEYSTSLNNNTDAIYVIIGECSNDVISGLTFQNNLILDISLCSKIFDQFKKSDLVRKIFPASSTVEFSELSDDALCNWNNDSVGNYTLTDNLQLNCKTLFTTGKGTPVITDIIINSSSYLLCACDFINNIKKSPKSLDLFIRCINYLSSKKHVNIKQATLIAPPNSALTSMFHSLDIPYKLLEHTNIEVITQLHNDDVLLVDGSCNLSFIDKLCDTSCKEIIIFNLSKDSIPSFMKDRLQIIHHPLNQLMRVTESDLIDGITEGDLYGLEPGMDIILSLYPIKILDQSITGILKNTNLDWNCWNYQGEDKKTISTYYNERLKKEDLYGLVKFKVNNIDITVNQLTLNASNNKTKKAFINILSNLNIYIPIKDNDEYIDMLNCEVYTSQLNKALFVTTAEKDIKGLLNPAINKKYSDTVWRIINNNSDIPTQNVIYGIYALSPTDRTDLLLNPDICGVTITSEFNKKLYLNGEEIANGKEIVLNGLQLLPSYNEILVLEERTKECNSIPLVIFDRKDNLPLDLIFSLSYPFNKEIVNTNWKFNSSENFNLCDNAIKGRGIEFFTDNRQHPGMFFEVDLGDIYNVSCIKLNSKSIKSDHIQWNSPRCFDLLISIDGINYKKAYNNALEGVISVIDGKLMLHFNAVEARFVKINITDVANKILAISELKIME